MDHSCSLSSFGSKNSDKENSNIRINGAKGGTATYHQPKFKKTVKVGVANQ
jgi:hypothetical protein